MRSWATSRSPAGWAGSCARGSPASRWAAAFGIGVAVQNAFGHARVGAIATLLLGGLVGLAVLAVVLWRMRISELQDIAALARGR